MSGYIRKPFEKENNFRDFELSYLTFFGLNPEYYNDVYNDKWFRLFNKNSEDDEGESIASPMLKITQKMSSGYNGKLVIKIIDARTNEVLSNNTMIIRRVEVYEPNTNMPIEVGRYTSPKRYGVGGSKAYPVKKEVCGKLRCIYKIHGSRKEHVKYKGQLITVAEYKKLMKAKA